VSGVEFHAVDFPQATVHVDIWNRFTVEPSQQGVRLIPINRSTPRVADE
jgi:hypothetical protein